MQKFWISLLISLSVSFAAVPSAAAMSPGDALVTLDIGGGIPETMLEANGESKIGVPGPVGGAEFVYLLLARVGIGVDIDYFSSGRKASGTLFSGYDTTLSADQLAALGIFRINLVDRHSFVLYLLGGAGAARLAVHGDIKPQPGILWPDSGTSENRTLFDSASTAFTYATGAGIDYFLTPRVFVGTQTRLDVVHNAAVLQVAPDLAGITCRWKGDEAMLKVLVRFGAKF